MNLFFYRSLNIYVVFRGSIIFVIDGVIWVVIRFFYSVNISRNFLGGVGGGDILG